MTTKHPQEAREGGAFTEAQIVAAGRALADNNAKVCNVNKDDNWKLYGDQFVEEARLCLAAALATPAPTDTGTKQADTDCGACPGDGSVCASTCKLAEESPKADTGASGEGEVKTWRQRAEEGDQDALTGDQCLRLAEQEINDLRAQLARLQAPVGESIDTPEFAKLLRDYVRAEAKWQDVLAASLRKDLIAHIDAQLQLARQRKGEPVAVVDEGDEGLFVEIIYGPDGSPLKLGDQLYLAPPSAQQEQGDAVRYAWRPMETAPKDGTMVRLLVEFTDNATEDSADPCPTIGANSYDNDGIDEWKFAGWNWSHDCFTEGAGKPVGWLPMLANTEGKEQQ